MEQLHIYVYGQLLAALAKLEGMKAANQERIIRQQSLAYNEVDFIDMSDEISNITNQLFK